MNPIAFRIGEIAVHWYGIMAALGLVAAFYAMNKNRQYANISEKQCETLLLIALFCGLVGARIFFVAEYFFENGFARNPLRILNLREGGLVFYGGFILAVLVLIIYTRKRGMDTIRVFDVFVPSMAIAHAFGRIGCFFTGCCYGRATDAFWGVTAPKGTLLWVKTKGEPIHPVQLLEAGENFILGAIFWWLLKKGVPRGVVVSSYFISYAVLRFFNELLRGDNDLFWKLTPGQWISIAMIIIGSGMLYFFLRKNHEKNA